jgi:hypothetical protein
MEDRHIERQGDVMGDPYLEGMLKKSIYADRCSVRGRLVGILNGELDDRNLDLISMPSRAMKRLQVISRVLTKPTRQTI